MIAKGAVSQLEYSSRTLVGIFLLLPALALPLGSAQAQMPGQPVAPEGEQHQPQHMPHDAGKAEGMEKPMMGGHGAAMAAMAASNKVKFEPSTVCKQCHASIYGEWTQSMHSRAREAWYFSHMVASERMNMVCNNELGKSIACQTCHEPAGVYPIADIIQKNPPAVAATEGVTCDVCHRVTTVEGTGAFSFGPMDEKRGPYRDAQSPYHKTVYAPLVESSDFCVACHGQLSNLNGLTVCDTTRAWRESRYAKEGKTCQSCHMPSLTGAAATGPGAPADAPKNRPRHSHVFRGPNGDPTILATAATVEQQVKRDPNGELRIQVKVTNSGTGHDMPSGLPDRLISLKVTGKDAAGKVVWENWKDDVYKEDRMAAFGLFGFNPMGGEVPPMGASRLDKLTLLPDESRTLQYKVDRAIAVKVRSVEAKLTYYAARPDEVLYSGVFDLPSVKPKPMTGVETRVR
jgi:hypothetical protein